MGTVPWRRIREEGVTRLNESSLEQLNYVTSRWPGLRDQLISTEPRARLSDETCDWLAWWRTNRAEQETYGEPAAYVVLIGVDSPQQLTALSEVWGDELHGLTIVEPDPPHLRWLIEQPELQPWLRHPFIHVRAGLDVSGLMGALTPKGALVGLNGLAVVVAPSLVTRQPEFDELIKALEHWREFERSSIQTRTIQRGRPLANILLNTAHLCRAGRLNEWENLLAGCPAFLVGGGPSLDDSLPRLKEAADCGAIIAVDTALTSLVQTGITPHVLVTADPTPANGEHFAKVPVPRETIVVWSPEVFHGVLASLSPGHATVVAPDRESPLALAMTRDLGLTTALPRTPQTGEMAFNLATLLGCDPLVLVGFDLAFSESDASTHAKGCALRRDVRASRDDGLFDVTGVEGAASAYKTAARREEGLGGESILVPPIFRQYRQRLEALIASRAGTTIDAGGRGARKQGTRVMSLSEVLSELDAEAPAQLPVGAVTEQEQARRSEILLRILDRALASLQSAMKLAPELEQALSAWPETEPGMAMPTVLEAHKSQCEMWDRLRPMDFYVEVLEPCLMHLLFERYRVVRCQGKPPESLNDELLQKHGNLVKQMVQNLQGFQTFANHARNALSE